MFQFITKRAIFLVHFGRASSSSFRKIPCIFILDILASAAIVVVRSLCGHLLVEAAIFTLMLFWTISRTSIYLKIKFVFISELPVYRLFGKAPAGAVAMVYLFCRQLRAGAANNSLSSLQTVLWQRSRARQRHFGHSLIGAIDDAFSLSRNHMHSHNSLLKFTVFSDVSLLFARSSSH